MFPAATYGQGVHHATKSQEDHVAKRWPNYYTQ